MGNKVFNITDHPDQYDILSQTPKNYSKDNYFIKELQDKVNADWPYRPNRVDIEFEEVWGSDKYSPIEVVVQSVKSDKGKDLSNDCRRIVFKDILEDRFRMGSKFRFSRHYKIFEPNELKNVWLVTNFDRVNLTASVVIERCNGTIGSIYVDEQGVSRYHYEPVIQGRELYSTNLRYADPIVAPQSQLTIICQHNDFTKNYFINERFIIGYDKVYRITAINKFYSETTYMPEDVGLMKIYLELTEQSYYDNFETRIAYQMTPTVHFSTTETGYIGDEKYSIGFKTPSFIPTDLVSTKITFEPIVTLSDGTIIPDIPIDVEVQLENLPTGVDPDRYIEFINNPQEGYFSLLRKKIYLNGELKVRCSVTAEHSPTGEEFSTEFKMVLRKMQEV